MVGATFVGATLGRCKMGVGRGTDNHRAAVTTNVESMPAMYADHVVLTRWRSRRVR